MSLMWLIAVASALALSWWIDAPWYVHALFWGAIAASWWAGRAEAR